MHLYVTLDDEILTVDNREERVEARRQMTEAGVAELMIWQGGPDEPCEATGQLLTSNPSHSPQDYDGSEEPVLVEINMPSEQDLANAIAALIDPETDSDMREDAHDEIDSWCSNHAPRAEVQTFRDAGLLTNDAGIVIRIGNTEFQITVQSRPR